GAAEEYGIVHLALSPAAGDGEAVDAVRVVLASLNPLGGRARVCLPAPHPATRPLLAVGWHVDFMDLFMATSPGLLDPRRAVPSPGPGRSPPPPWPDLPDHVSLFTHTMSNPARRCSSAGACQLGMMAQRTRFSPYCQSVPISANPAARSAAMCWLSSTDSEP